MLLDDLLSLGESALQNAVEKHMVESLTLDFKEFGSGDQALFYDGQVTKQGRRAIGPALSAFANSAGGTLVIGVRCKRIDGVDAATQLLPTANLKKCESSLAGQLGSMLQPRHDGLRLHAISSIASPDHGYLVIDVPRSERRPHMSQIDGLYYKRSSSSTFRMEHYDIEDAFRRISGPLLSLSWKTQEDTDLRLSPVISIPLYLSNVGVSSAKNISVSVRRTLGPEIRVERHMHLEWRVNKEEASVQIVAPQDLVLNPAQTIRFHSLHIAIGKDAFGQPTAGGMPPAAAFLEAELQLSAENMWPATQLLRLGPPDFLPLVVRRNT